MADRRVTYTPPSYEEMAERAEKKGSLFDNLFKDVKIYSAKQGANLLRILPPTWKGARHYGLEIFIHYDVGPQDQRYLCLKENPSSPYDRCPICESLYDLGSRASKEDKQLLLPKRSFIYYVIDRDNEKDGVQVYMASATIDAEIASQCVSSRTKSLINIVDPDEGYDIEFMRKGTGRNGTRYHGFKAQRDSSPLSDSDRRYNEWIDQILDHPLDSVLNFYSPERVEAVHLGSAKDEGRRKRSEDDDEPRNTRSRSRNDDDEEDEAPRGRRTAVEDEPRTLTRRRDPEPEEEERQQTRRASPHEDDIPRKSLRSRSRDDDDEEREEVRKPPRSRLSRELDDEIPFDEGRKVSEREERSTRRATNGHDREETAERGDSRREEEGTRNAPQRTRERLAAPPPEEDDEDDGAARAERLRARLNRSMSLE